MDHGTKQAVQLVRSDLLRVDRAHRPAGSTKRPAQPSAKLNQSSSADSRAGSNTRPARPSAELDQPSLADGRAGPNTLPARPSAELERSCYHSPVFVASSFGIGSNML
ncbi:hypothetical protein F2Q70_00029747 [Brassica cretica]|uniref:Uncharacterized protein n=1 Tax=Brassica cretica TaxID=69181 RepID=A0A8S9FKM9_BRACR|nr:hypothetical protein F2Q70_00029747 [Brassica cretica]